MLITCLLDFLWQVDAKVGKVDAEGNVQGITDRKLDLPAGTVLAYQIAELSINDEGGWCHDLS